MTTTTTTHTKLIFDAFPVQMNGGWGGVESIVIDCDREVFSLANVKADFPVFRFSRRSKVDGPEGFLSIATTFHFASVLLENQWDQIPRNFELWKVFHKSYKTCFFKIEQQFRGRHSIAFALLTQPTRV